MSTFGARFFSHPVLIILKLVVGTVLQCVITVLCYLSIYLNNSRNPDTIYLIATPIIIYCNYILLQHLIHNLDVQAEAVVHVVLCVTQLWK